VVRIVPLRYTHQVKNLTLIGRAKALAGACSDNASDQRSSICRNRFAPYTKRQRTNRLEVI